MSKRCLLCTAALLLTAWPLAQAQQDRANQGANQQGRNQQGAQQGQNQAGQNQQRGIQQGQAQQRGAQAGSQSQQVDELFASGVLLSNQNEIELAQLGQQKASHEKVKEFAAKLASDHKQFVSKLEKHAAPEVRDRATGSGREGASRTTGQQDGTRRDSTQRSGNQAANTRTDDDQDATRRTGDAQERREERREERDERRTERREETGQRRDAAGQAATRQGAPGQARGAAGSSGQEMVSVNQLIQIEHQIAQECLRSAREELQDKSGTQFDQAFIGMQLAMHMAMIDKLKVLEQHVSSDLQDLFAQGRKTSESHYEQAKEIMKTLDGARETAGKNEKTTK